MRLSKADLTKAAKIAGQFFDDLLEAARPGEPAPAVEGLTDRFGVLMAETDAAISYILWLLYSAKPTTPMAVAAATHLAGGHGALVFLTGLLYGPAEVVLTIRIPRELSSEQLRAMLTIAGFARVKTLEDCTYEEWLW